MPTRKKYEFKNKKVFILRLTCFVYFNIKSQNMYLKYNLGTPEK